MAWSPALVAREEEAGRPALSLGVAEGGEGNDLAQVTGIRQEVEGAGEGHCPASPQVEGVLEMSDGQVQLLVEAGEGEEIQSRKVEAGM